MVDNGSMSHPTAPDPRQQPGADPRHPGPSFGGPPAGPSFGPPPAHPDGAPQPTTPQREDTTRHAPPSGAPRPSLYGELPGPRPYSQQYHNSWAPSPHAPQPRGYGLYGWTGPQVPRKEPVLGLVASFFIPGLGSIINGNVGRGIGILVGYFVALLLSVILIGIPIALGLWIWGMVDGYQGAVTRNRENGYPS